MLTITHATDHAKWDAFLATQQYRPFLQSWTMGEVYRACGQEPIRLQIEDETGVAGICLATVVPARRGKHLSIPYGPILARMDLLPSLLTKLAAIAQNERCTFIRCSPFWREDTKLPTNMPLRERSSPLHLLAEHLWYVPLRSGDPWQEEMQCTEQRTEEVLLADMRKTTRNLIRRAEKDGVTIERTADPLQGLEHFLRLHEETRKRHRFVPYSSAFFRAQIKHFASRKEVSVYLAKFQGDVIAASIHMHAFGETSYHHGASSSAHAKIPSSYLLQWTAMRDALTRGDSIYNFWGIAPTKHDADGTRRVENAKHPFAGVTLFKTGFGGKLLPLVHCRDYPLSPLYELTRAFEILRKWRRGF